MAKVIDNGGSGVDPERLRESGALARNGVTAPNPLDSFLNYAKTRPAELDALAAALPKTPEQLRESGAFQNYGTITPGVTPMSESPSGIPDINNRSKVPTEDPGKGYKWQWFSMATSKNQYGGEWRKVPSSSDGGGGSSSGGGGGSTGGGGTTDTATALAEKAAADKAAADAAAGKAARQSAYNVLYDEFKKYGLESLVEDIKGMIQDAKVSPSEFSLALQNTKAYQQRFSANQDRIKAGLQALDPATYIGLEDKYQSIMRNYGLPGTYYAKTDQYGSQAGLNKLIANDVSAAELEDRIITAQQRVLNSDPNVMNALKSFYPNITQSDLLAYTLDPTNALNDIKRKVTAAEIGGAALDQNLMTSQRTAEELAKYGVTKAQAQQGYQTIGQFLPSATNLADIYQGQGFGPYTQQTAEQEIFGTAGAAEAAQKRKKLSQLEQAQFAAKSGASQGALSRDRAMSPYMLGTPGAGAF